MKGSCPLPVRAIIRHKRNRLFGFSNNERCGSRRSRSLRGGGAGAELSQRGPPARGLGLVPERGPAPAGGSARGEASQPHDPQRYADRSRPAPAGAPEPGPERGRRRARCGQRLSRFADRDPAAQRAHGGGPSGAPADHRSFSHRSSGHQSRSDHRGQLRRCAGGRLRRGYPLRRAAGKGHDRGADRPARAALRRRRSAVLSRRPRPAFASEGSSHSRLHPPPLRQRRDASLGIRARRRDREDHARTRG